MAITAKVKSPDAGVTKRIAAVKTYLDAKPGAVASSLPSVRGVSLYKVMGKMFAILGTHHNFAVTVKCDTPLIEILKEQYEGVSQRFHLDKRFWIGVALDGDVPLTEIKHLIDGSYGLICAKLTRKRNAELEALSS